MRSLAARWGVGVLGLWAAAGIVSSANADVVFDFEAEAGNRDNSAGDFTALSLESDGVWALIYRTSGERFTVWNSGGEDVPGSWGSKHLSPVFNFVIDDYLVMSFSEPMSQVTIEFGDYGEDHDLAELFAYAGINETGSMLGRVTGELGDDDMRYDAPTTLTFVAEAGQSFRSIKFRGGQDPFLQSTFIDNVVTRVVPTPGGLVALGLACAVGSSAMRRRGGRRA